MTHYALSALKEKRSTLAGEVSDFERRIAKRRQQIAHIDATIRIFAPDFDVDALPAKQVRTKARQFGRGEITRVVYDILRTTEKPLTVAEMTDKAMPLLGKLETERRAVNRQIRNKLTYHMVNKGTVKGPFGKKAKAANACGRLLSSWPPLSRGPWRLQKIAVRRHIIARRKAMAVYDFAYTTLVDPKLSSGFMLHKPLVKNQGAYFFRHFGG